MKVKIKKLHLNAVLPKYAKSGDAGMDLTCVEASYQGDLVTYHTGLAVEIPQGYVGLLFPRSSVYKTGQRLTNSVGVIDCGYRGEIMLKYTRHVSNAIFAEYDIGDRVGQLIITAYPQIQFEEVQELSSSIRGEDGFGSTGV